MNLELLDHIDCYLCTVNFNYELLSRHQWLDTSMGSSAGAKLAVCLCSLSCFVITSFVPLTIWIYKFSLVEKTIEGTAAGITSVLAACSILLPLLATTRYVQVSLSLSHTLSLSLWTCTKGCRHAYPFIPKNGFHKCIFMRKESYMVMLLHYLQLCSLNLFYLMLTRQISVITLKSTSFLMNNEPHFNSLMAPTYPNSCLLGELM